MATDKNCLNYILDQLSGLKDISFRAMMGEYIIYYRGKIAAYLCDNRLLVKPTASACALMPGASYEPPYEGAKPMLLVEKTDDRAFLAQLFEVMYDELPSPKLKKSGKY